MMQGDNIAVPPPEYESRWSDLTEELLDQIIARVSLPDCLRLGSVCRPWRSVMLARRPPPLLVELKPLYDGVSDLLEDKYELLFFSLTEGKYEKLPIQLAAQVFVEKLPELQLSFKRLLPCFGNSNVWLEVRAENYEEPYSGELNYLVNPVTGERTNLPKIKGSMLSVTLSSPPTSSDCIVIANKDFEIVDNNDLINAQLQDLEARTTALASWKVGDDEWIVFDESPCSPISMAFHKNRLYVNWAYGKTKVYAFDPHPRFIGWVDDWVYDFYVHFGAYVADSGEELFLVVKLRKGFQVFMLDAGRWIRIKDVSDRVFIISGGDALSFRTKQVMGSAFRGNCIYYLDTCYRLSVYSIKDGSCKKLVSPQPTAGGGLWVTPIEWSFFQRYAN